MPDEQEALAAIAQLQGKEILGRPINVVPALSKEPKSKPAGKRNKYSSGVVQDNQESLRPGYQQSNPRHDPSLGRTGKYKEGRRSLSYLKQRLESGITPVVSGRKYKSNPMRWRKKPRSQAFFSKPEGELKPWQRPQTELNPWKKPQPKSNSWKKVEGEPKFWGKNRGASRPWIKSEGREARPWKKTESVVSRPWKKTAIKSKPWRKRSVDRAQSGFKKRSSSNR
jgi:hypothetical protein